jgi:hypothetical protein
MPVSVFDRRMMDHLDGPRHQAFPHRVPVFAGTCLLSDTRGQSCRMPAYTGVVPTHKGHKAWPVTMWNRLHAVRNECAESA